MDKVRIAVVIATADKYVTTVFTLLTTAIVARIINPAEFGITVLGGAALLLANTLRDVGTSAYIIQTPELTTGKARAVFTMNLILTAVILVGLLLSSPFLAIAFNTPGLGVYLQVCAAPFAVGAIVYPLHALLARDLAFGKLAVVNIISTLVNSVTLIVTAYIGASYMSFAFAQVVSAIAGTVLLVYFRPSFEIFRPSLKFWKEILSFSIFSGGTGIVQRASEVISVMTVGVFMTPAMVGLLNRASMISQFPERTIMAGVNAAALPAFSKASREKGDMRRYYLAAVERISGLIWPCLAMIILLANPLIRVFLGDQWLETIPLVQIIAGGLLLNFPPGINYPILVAAGAVRKAFMLSILQSCVALPIIAVSAQFGLEAVAWATWPIVAINVILSTHFVKAYVAKFSWLDLLGALKLSLLSTLAAIAGPAVIIWHAGGFDQIGIVGSIAAVAIACPSWLLALWALRHPLFAELSRAIRSILLRLNRMRPADGTRL